MKNSIKIPIIILVILLAISILLAMNHKEKTIITISFDDIKNVEITKPDGETVDVIVDNYWIKNGIISVTDTEGQTYIVPIDDIYVLD